MPISLPIFDLQENASIQNSFSRSAAANIDRYIKSILGLLQGRVRVGLGCYRGRVGCYPLGYKILAAASCCS
jgi:hypothetical protein